ncbi:MAG TPA: SDR family NAD(P)-dependent oxidoreductase, partial [Thermoleophilaceae bacterium]
AGEGSRPGGAVATARLDLGAEPWLADHALGQAPIAPGALVAELCLAVGGLTGADDPRAVLGELTLQSPLALADDSSQQLQVTIDAAGPDGERALTLHARSAAGGEWRRHAAGALVPAAEPAAEPLDGDWPPPGAEELDPDELYADLLTRGLAYGPAFQGLRRGWLTPDGDVLAEVELAPAEAAAAERYLIHPALLDACLQAAFWARPDGPAALMPFALSGLAVHRPAAAALRVRVRPLAEDDSYSLDGFTPDGEPAFTLQSVTLRPLADAEIAPTRGAGAELMRVEWRARAETPAGEPAVAAIGPGDDPAAAGDGAEALLWRVEEPERAEPAATHALLEDGLALLKRVLAEDEAAGARLVVATRGAHAVRSGEEPSIAQAALAGLMRSARSEHPGRIALVDLDPAGGDEEAERPAIAAALASPDDDVALRDGELLAARLARAREKEEVPGEPEVDPDLGILITGGTGMIGARLARRLAERGARRLVLVSRSGPAASGAAELRDELRELGAAVSVHACDLADRDELAAVLDSARPIGSVVHAAGVLADALVGALEPDALRRVVEPKLDAALLLDELTAGDELYEFVVFSSVASTLGTAGQANYAAANAALEALCARRRAAGRPARALAWGPWEEQSTMTAAMSETDRRRLVRLGVAALATETGLDMFESARARPEHLLVAAELDAGALAAAASSGTLPAPFADLVRAPRRRADAGPRAPLRERVAGLEGQRRAAALLDGVRAELAVVLGHAEPAAVDPSRQLREQGLDSLGAVELRNRLAQASGLKLPPTIVFDHPSATALADYLGGRLEGRSTAAPRAARARSSAAAEEPIAIVGMACRYPGGVSSPEDLWRLVAERRDVIGPFPRDRGWDLEGLFDDDPSTPGTTNCRGGGFLPDAADFDAGFFGIAAREALAMDPQQRLLLETAWEALEHAGIDPISARGTETGVYAGVMDQGFGDGPRPAELEGLVLTGLAASVASGRVAYALGLEGPAITLDTACSSSLVALHLACGALRAGECERALAGGVAVLATPRVFIEFGRQGGMSPDGRCKAFSDRADGTGWAEGAGLLVLERLSEAQAAGRRIHAVVRGSAINQDGASNGLSAPSGAAQERVIAAALANARLRPRDVDAVEAHGTGTRLGDPIEATALLATCGQDRDEPLRLGTLKSNIGHSQAAAGVGGVIKMALALRHEELPATLHAERPSTQVDWSAGAVELLTEPVPWPRREGRPRRAGVSSFGVSGTNAHVIVEEPPQPAAREETDGPPAAGGTMPWLLSARSDGALRAQAERLAEHLERHPDASDDDVAHTLWWGRARLEQRAAVTGPRADRLAALRALAAGGSAAGLVRRPARIGRGGLCLMFTGEGAPPPGMAAGLHSGFPLFADALDAALAALPDEIGDRLRALLVADADPAGASAAAALGAPELAQPALFCFEAALQRLLHEGFAVRPDYVIGHSIGEVAAACAAGVLSLEDGARLAAARGRLAASFEDAAAELEELCRGLALEPAAIPIAASLTGAIAEPEELADPAYWARQAREGADVEAGLLALREAGVVRFVELGPGAALATAAEDVLAGAEGEPPLVAGLDGTGAEAIGELAGRLAVDGLDPDPAPLFADRPHGLCELPTYPFERRRYWLWSDGDGAAGAAPGSHPLLGAPEELAGGRTLATARVELSAEPWLGDHAIAGTTIAPAALLAELCVAAAGGGATLEELAFEEPLPLSGDGAQTLQVTLHAAGADGTRALNVHARAGDDGEWRRHAGGAVSSGAPAPPAKLAAEWPPAAAVELDPEELYARLLELGVAHGPAFQCLRRGWRAEDGEVLAEVELAPAEAAAAESYLIHPALLDACLQAVLWAGADEGGRPLLPFALRKLAVHRPGAAALRVRVRPVRAEGSNGNRPDASGASFAVEAFTAGGEPVFTLERVDLRPLPAAALGPAAGGELLAFEWRVLTRVDGEAGAE